MDSAMTKASLSPARRRLVELMQAINFGRIEGLQVQNGEPVIDPPPAVLRLYQFGKDNGPNASLCNDAYTLKKRAVELFMVFDRERSISIRELIIANGLPVRMTVADGVGDMKKTSN